MITNWRDLKIGQHITLSCGCQGFVRDIMPDESEENHNTGFNMVYTKNGCNSNAMFLEQSYYEGYGPYTNCFNYDLSDNAMPAEETAAPAWFPSLEAGFRVGKPVPNPSKKGPLETGLFINTIDGDMGWVMSIDENKITLLVTGNENEEHRFLEAYGEGLKILKNVPLDVSWMEWRPPYWLADFPKES